MSLKSLVITSTTAFALTMALPSSSHAQPPQSTQPTASSPANQSQPPSGTASGTTDRQGQSQQPSTVNPNQQQPPTQQQSPAPPANPDQPSNTATPDRNREMNRNNDQNRTNPDADRNRTQGTTGTSAAPSGQRSVGTRGQSGAGATAQDPNNPSGQANTARGNNRQNLPKTASQLPLMIFMALGAFAGVGVLRLYRLAR